MSAASRAAAAPSLRPGMAGSAAGEHRVSQLRLEACPLAHHPGDHDRPKQATTMGPDLSIEVWRAKFVVVLSQHGTSERIRERPENF